MKINEDCIRDILGYLIENLTIKADETKFAYAKIDTLQIINNLSLTSYSKEDIVYSIHILAELQFINGDNLMQHSPTSYTRQTIYNVTYRGQRFYETIRPESTWEKTKGVINTIGVHTLEFIESIAHDMVVESAKEATAIIVNKHI